MIADSLGRHSLKEDFMVDWTDLGFEVEVEVYTCIGLEGDSSWLL
jgi:hypothetical protein